MTALVRLMAASLLVLLLSGCGFFSDMFPEKRYAAPGDVPARYQHLLVLPQRVPPDWELLLVATYDDNFMAPHSILEYGLSGSQKPLLTIRTSQSQWALPPSATNHEEWELANGERVDAAWVGDRVFVVWKRSSLSHLIEAELGPDLPKETVIRLIESMAP